MNIKRTLVAIPALFYGGVAAAANAGGGGLAWEQPLLLITNSFTGPVAFAASSIATVASLATLAFADNLSGAGRQLVYLVLIIAALIGVVNLLQTLFAGGASLGESGALYVMVASAIVLAAALAVARLQLSLIGYLVRRHRGNAIVDA